MTKLIKNQLNKKKSNKKKNQIKAEVYNPLNNVNSMFKHDLIILQEFKAWLAPCAQRCMPPSEHSLNASSLVSLCSLLMRLRVYSTQYLVCTENTKHQWGKFTNKINIILQSTDRHRITLIELKRRFTITRRMICRANMQATVTPVAVRVRHWSLS